MWTAHSIAELFRAFRFALVGGAATLDHLGAAQGAFAAGLSAPLSNLSGFALAFAVGLLGHHYFTFPGIARFGSALHRYAVIVLFALVAGGMVSERVALAVAILVIPVDNFLASRFWGFVPPTS